LAELKKLHFFYRKAEYPKSGVHRFKSTYAGNMRRTSIETYNKIAANGLLSQRRWEVYDALYAHGPCTSSELFQKMGDSQSHVFGNIRARLNELRDLGVADELRERPCLITGQTVIEWDVTDRLPVKLEKPHREKCRQCAGKGYIVGRQGRLF
jgi:hypothetical protein